MVAQRQKELSFPLRWWSFGPFWRYERPQKGRSREFFQWNVDLLGVDTPEADAEIVAVLASFFRSVALTPSQVLILVGSRKQLDEQLASMKIPEARRPSVTAWIDRRGKLEAAAWRASGEEEGLIPDQIQGLEAYLEDERSWEGSDELVRFFAAMNAMGLQDYVRFNAGVVRGLAYYTGTVFEAWDIGGDIRRAILGGGRYDNLLAAVGGEPVAAVGFAMGDVVLGLLLEKYGLLPANLAATPAQVLVTVFDKNLQPTSLTVASELRNAGVNAATYPAVATLQKQFKYADRLGVRFVIVIGSDEVTANEVLVKDLRSGEQERVGRAMVAADLKRRLGDTDATLKGAS
jgi:histidyl-tRNA synthetase